LIGWSQLRISGHADATAFLPNCAASGLDVGHPCDDAVDGGPCIPLNNRPLLSLLLAKLPSTTSPEKPPATYTWVNDFGRHMDSIFTGEGGRLIRESDLYSSIYGK